MRFVACLFATALASSAALAAPISPAEILPPVLPWQGASEALIRPASDPWVTPSELTGLTETPSYAETIAWLEKLAEASPRIKLVDIGQTAQGRTLYLVVASKEGAETAEQLTANHRPTLLAQAGIHSGEIDGKDAGLMLLRDLAFTAKGSLLDHANFVLLPVFNADGHERRSEFNRPNQRGPRLQGWRTTAQNLNLNRDYMKLDAPEMRALIDVLDRWQPELYLDLHVTDGIDYAYDITFGYNGYAGTFAWSSTIGRWLDDVLRPALNDALEESGHHPGPLVFPLNNRDLAQGLSFEVTTPRFSNGYGDLRGIPSVLVENHSLKPYKQRVLGTYVLLEAALRTLGAHADSVTQAIETDLNARPATLPANFGVPRDVHAKIPFAGVAFETYDSPVSGGKEVRWLGQPKLYEDIVAHFDQNGATLVRPRAYYVPVTKPDVIERLRMHGIECEELDEAKTVRVTMARLVDPKPDAMPFEGHHGLKVSAVKWETHDEEFPAGSVRVSTDQQLGNLAMMLLDPLSNESFLAWGFFPEILQRTEYIEGYALAPLAEKMLAADPQLKAEFEAKLAADEKFRGSPDARLRWFYERSPFYDARYLLYPVGLERDADAPLSGARQ